MHTHKRIRGVTVRNQKDGEQFELVSCVVEYLHIVHVNQLRYTYVYRYMYEGMYACVLQCGL